MPKTDEELNDYLKWLDHIEAKNNIQQIIDKEASAAIDAEVEERELRRHLIMLDVRNEKN